MQLIYTKNAINAEIMLIQSKNTLIVLKNPLIVKIFPLIVFYFFFEVLRRKT